MFFTQGKDELDIIGTQLNAFLRQAGYYRPNECMFMTDLTEDEVGALEDYLGKYREEKKRQNENQNKEAV